ncbi:unnamed protein product [Sphagnum tenellum]
MSPPSSAVAELGSHIGSQMTFSEAQIKKTKTLVSQMSKVNKWTQKFDYDCTEVAFDKLQPSIARLQVDEKIKTTLREMRFTDSKTKHFDVVDYQNNELKTCHAFVAARKDPVTSMVTMMYIVLETNIVLSKEGRFSWLGGPCKELSAKDIELLKTTYLPHQLMQQLQSRNIINRIAYVS